MMCGIPSAGDPCWMLGTGEPGASVKSFISVTVEAAGHRGMRDRARLSRVDLPTGWPTADGAVVLRLIAVRRPIVGPLRAPARVVVVIFEDAEVAEVLVLVDGVIGVGRRRIRTWGVVRCQSGHLHVREICRSCR